MRKIAFLAVPGLEPAVLVETRPAPVGPTPAEAALALLEAEGAKTVAVKPRLLDARLLEACSALTPLVEPVQDGIFLDLNGCGRQDELLARLAGMFTAGRQDQGCLGLAGSRIAALMASRWPDFRMKLPFCRVRSIPGLMVAEVASGQERNFLGYFRLEDFPLLKKNEARRLKRAGFMKIAELQDMSGRQLGRLLGRSDAGELETGLKAADGGLVLGLYPPERLFYRRVFEPEIGDRERLEEQLGAAAGLLGRCLEERHACARRLSLRLQTGAETLEAERILQIGCAGPGRLRRLLEGMLWHTGLNRAVDGLDIGLAGLEPVRLEQPGLFSEPGRMAGSWRERVVEDSLEKIRERFPEVVTRGLEMDRREQVLSFWDPWRFEEEM